MAFNFMQRIFASGTFRQVTSTIIVWIYALLYGFAKGWIGPAVKFLISSDSSISTFTKDNIFWIPTASTCGNIFGVILSTFLSRYMGRKILFAAGLITLIIGWSLNLLADTMVEVLIAQFIIRSGIGVYNLLQCLYVSEIASTRNRGIFISINLICYTVGMEMQYMLSLFGEHQLLSLIPLLLSVIGFFSLLLTVESPEYLLTKQNSEKALKSINTLNAGDAVKVRQIYEDLVTFTKDGENSSDCNYLKSMALPENYKMSLCVTLINVMVYVGGTTVFMEYATIIMAPFEDKIDIRIVLNIVGITNVVGTVLSPLVVDTFGRRALVLYGFLLLAATQLGMSLCFYEESVDQDAVQYIPQSIVASATISQLVYSATLLPIAHVLRAELFPYRLKEIGNCVLVTLKSVVEGSNEALFLPVAGVLGMGFNFGVYFVVAFVGAVFTRFFLLETKGKTLVEIKNDYENDSKNGSRKSSVTRRVSWGINVPVYEGDSRDPSRRQSMTRKFSLGSSVPVYEINV